MAAGGTDILDQAGLHDSLNDAARLYHDRCDDSGVGECQNLHSDLCKRQNGCATTPAQAANQLLFGPERAGLDNDAVGYADFIITVPLNPQFASLNLGQAVLLMGWEARKALMEPVIDAVDPAANPHLRQHKERFCLKHWKVTCMKAAFFTSARNGAGGNA